jgi:hypothetical protein
MSRVATRLKSKVNPPAASGSTVPSGNSPEVPKDIPEEPPDPRPAAAPAASLASSSSFPFLSPTPLNTPPDWAQRALENAEFLWSTVDRNILPIENSPQSAESIKILCDIRQLMEKTNRAIGSALNGTKADQPPAQPIAEDLVLKAIEDLSVRMRTQEEAILQIKKAAAPVYRNVPTPSPFPTPSPLPLPPNPDNGPSPATVPKPTYSQTTANNRPILNRTKVPTTLPINKPTPTPPPTTLQYIVRFQGKPPPPENRWQNERATKKVNSAFDECPNTKNKLKVIAATLRPNGNYVITFSADSSPRLIEENKTLISKALAPDHPTAIVTKNEPWTKVVVHRISLLDDTLRPRTAASLLEAISVNPILKDVRITHPPSWVKSDENLKGRTFSAISFAFIDKQDPILPSLLKEPFFMFGTPAQVERWQEKLRPIQCKKCWHLTHTVKQCRCIHQRCRRCGKMGSEEQHREHCDECKKLPDAPALCVHSSCPNCLAKDHCADDPQCPVKLANAAKLKSRPTAPNPPTQTATSQQ